MTITINVNGLSMCHKGSAGFVRSTLPDICLTPGKGGYPVPYVNVAYSRDLEKGSVSVFADGGHSCAIKPSEFSRSFGDEPGKGGGIKSGVNEDRATWLSWSADVFIEGEPVCRLSDKMMLNRGNTVSVGGEQQPPLDMDDWLKELCEIACECKNAIYFQRCMAKKIEDKYYDKGYPKSDSPYWREVSMTKGDDGWDVIRNRAGDAPTSNPFTPRGGIRPDIIGTDGAGNPTGIFEIKFPGDKLNPNQRPGGGAYSRAANDLGVKYKPIEIVKDCAFCWDPPPPPPPKPVPAPNPVPAPVPAPVEEHVSNWGWDVDWAAVGTVVLGVAIVGGVVACAVSVVCGLTAAGATAATAVVVVGTTAVVGNTNMSPGEGVPSA